jgi:O-antigen/teichoic acid export membrane protein
MTADDDLLKSVVAIFTGNGAIKLIGIVFTPLLVRVLSQPEYGVFASVMALFGIIELVSKVGLFDSVRKHVAEHPLGSREQGEMAVASVLIAIGYGGVATLGGVILVYVPSPLSGEYATYFLVLVSAVVASNVFAVSRGVFYGRQQEGVSAKIAVFRRLTYSALGLVLAYIGLGVFGVFLGYTVAIYASAIVGGGLVYRTLDIDITRSLAALRKHGRKIAVYGGIQATGGVASLLLYKTDILLVDFFRASAETALYKAALTPAELIWFVPSVIQAALLQNASDHWSNGRIAAINENVKTGLKYAFLALTLFAVGLFALAREFLAVYFGSTYGASAFSLRVLLVGTFFFGLSRILVPVLQGTGWIKYTESVAIVALGVNIGLNVLLIPRYGIRGAATATAISYCFIFLGTLLVWLATDFELPSRGTIARLCASLAVFALVYVPVVNRSDIGTIASLLVFPVFGGISYVLICLLFGLVETSDLRRALSTILPNVL